MKVQVTVYQVEPYKELHEFVIDHTRVAYVMPEGGKIAFKFAPVEETTNESH